MYYTHSGKPDQKRRYGQPWDPSVYKDAMRTSVGTTDVNGKDVADQVKAQNSANQFLQYGSLLAPVMEGMAILQEKLTGQKPEVLEVAKGKNLKTKVQIRKEQQVGGTCESLTVLTGCCFPVVCISKFSCGLRDFSAAFTLCIVGFTSFCCYCCLLLLFVASGPNGGRTSFLGRAKDCCRRCSRRWRNIR